MVKAGEFHPGPNPKPDMQVSKHPAFQMNLSTCFPRGSELVASKTKGLDVIQAVRHFEVGKAVDRFGMVRLRGLGRNRDPAATAMKAVANQAFHLRSSQPGPRSW